MQFLLRETRGKKNRTASRERKERQARNLLSRLPSGSTAACIYWRHEVELQLFSLAAIAVRLAEIPRGKPRWLRRILPAAKVPRRFAAREIAPCHVPRTERCSNHFYPRAILPRVYRYNRLFYNLETVEEKFSRNFVIFSEEYKTGISLMILKLD